jgi:putative endopeptidase
MRILKALLPVLLLSQLVLSQSAALHSIDVTDLDRKVDPCNDFYEFANGSWRANHAIPATMVRWSRRWESGETTKDKLKDVLEVAQQDTAAAKGSTDQIIGDYYGACMDESRVNARGIEPLNAWFAKIDAVKDTGGLQPVIADMQDINVAVPFNLASATDPHKPTWVLADLGASGYALPDRDYYLKPDARFKEAR